MNATAARVLSCVFLVMLSASVPARELRVELPNHGSVVLTVPNEWTDRVERPQGDLPPTINLSPGKPGAFHILITPIWPANAGIPKPTRDSVREMVSRAADDAKSHSVEADLPLKELTWPTAFAFYFSATDRAPEPNGFKYLTQGAMALADFRITFTILVNGESAPVVEQAFQVLRSLRLDPGTSVGVKSTAATQRRFSLPSSAIGIVFPGDDWVVGQERLRPDRTAAYYMLSSAKRKIAFSFYIDKTTDCQSAKACLNAALKNPAYSDAKELQMSENGPFAVARFFIDSPRGLNVYQANLLASAYVDGQWFDVHLSATDTQRPDMGRLVQFLQQVEIR